MLAEEGAPLWFEYLSVIQSSWFAQVPGLIAGLQARRGGTLLCTLDCTNSSWLRA